MNGFVMLFVNLAVLILAIVGIVNSIIELDRTDGHQGGWLLGGSLLFWGSPILVLSLPCFLLGAFYIGMGKSAHK